MHKRHTLMILALVGMVASTLACNAPTPTPQDQPPVETPDSSPVSSPQETAPPPTDTPSQPTFTPTPPAITETPSPTPTPTETPTPEPVSTGPLDFPVPAALDHWRPLENGEQEATIILRISGGAPPYTIHHDQSITTTWETRPKIIFQAQGCSALVHTIIVESADGQSVKHDYWIPVPWCDD